MGTFEGRFAFLVSCVSDVPKKIISQKPNSRKTIRSRVAFLRTLKINESRLKVALNKHKHSDTLTDVRGKLSGGRNALHPSKKDEVCEHIDSFPKYISHYTRNQTDAKYLNCDLNLAKVYELYKCIYQNPVSKSFYKKNVLPRIQFTIQNSLEEYMLQM